MAQKTTETRWADRDEDFEFWARTRKASAQRLREAIAVFRQINQSLQERDTRMLPRTQ